MPFFTFPSPAAKRPPEILLGRLWKCCELSQRLFAAPGMVSATLWPQQKPILVHIIYLVATLPLRALSAWSFPPIGGRPTEVVCVPAPFLVKNLGVLISHLSALIPLLFPL